MVTIPIKKTLELAKTPTRGSNSAAGYDLYSTEEYTLKPLERKLFKTGIHIAIPVGLYGRIAPRSGLAYKDGIDTMAGVIDEDYRGDVGVILINLGSVEKKISVGDKIAQIIFENYTAASFHESDNLPETNRGQDGFGSTDTPRVSVGPPTYKEDVHPTADGYAGPKPGKSLAEMYEKTGGVTVKQRYSEEIKERQQQ
jgi:dUTP pyrophosphatase